MVDLIETAPRRTCGLRWRPFWGLRIGELAVRAEIATHGLFLNVSSRGKGEKGSEHPDSLRFPVLHGVHPENRQKPQSSA